MKINRQQYDLLVEYYPFWMKYEWPKVDRQWYTYGAEINSHINIIKNMLDNIDKWL